MVFSYNTINVDTDILVIGGGMAGFFAAIKAKERGLDVTLVDKNYAGKSGSTHFSEGDFTFLDPRRGHKPEQWLEQINKASEYLNNRTWGEIYLNESYDRYKDLVAWGVQFFQKDGKPFIGHAGVHEHYCFIHREYAPALRRKAIASKVKIIDRIMVCEIIIQEGRVAGAIGFHTISGNLYVFKAKAIVVTTGGSSIKLIAKPTHYWTSDGEAMAYRAGVEITGKEFMTGDRPPVRKAEDVKKTIESVNPEEVVEVLARYPSFRGSVMGPGARPTINAEGGLVTTAVWEAHCGRAPLYINYDTFVKNDPAWLNHFYTRMGTIELDKINWDIYKGGKVKFSPGRLENVQGINGAAGIWPVNTHCSTALPGLYAAGNCCATMVSGASYAGMGLGLSGASVTGTRAGMGAAEYALKSSPVNIGEEEMERVKKIVCSPMERKGGFSPAWVTQLLQGFVVPYFVLRIKHEERMQAVLVLIEFVNQHLIPKLMANDAHEWRMAQETKNMALNIEMILRASIFRKESRGGHFREDIPSRHDPEWLAWVKIREVGGTMTLSKEPIPKEWWPDLSKPYEELYPRMFPGE